MRRRRAGGTAGVLALAAVLVGAAPGLSATPATAATLPAPPPCATAVALSDGAKTTRAVPLPAPASDVGGARLASPGLQVDLGAGARRPPALRTTAWMVADLDTGAVLAACNAHVPLAPASTLKVLTALALHPRVGGGARYVARREDAAIDGTKVGLSPGSLYTGDDLWHGLLMGSGNDAANALATLAGGMPAATGLMTQTARSLGAADTRVVNTSGLDAAGQVSSAYDLALFGRALLRDPALAGIVGTRVYAFPGKGSSTQRSKKTYQIANHNVLLGRYAGTTGVKNGYTKAAGASLVLTARRGGHAYIVTMLRGQPDVWHMGSALLDWAFANGTRTRPVGTLDVPPVPATDPSSSGADPAAAGRGSSGGAGTSRVPSVVAAPVRAALEGVPASSRTPWLLGALAVALAGGAAVRRLVLRRAGAAPPRPKKGPRTPSKRSSR